MLGDKPLVAVLVYPDHPVDRLVIADGGVDVEADRALADVLLRDWMCLRSFSMFIGLVSTRVFLHSLERPRGRITPRPAQGGHAPCQTGIQDRTVRRPLGWRTGGASSRYAGGSHSQRRCIRPSASGWIAS